MTDQLTIQAAKENRLGLIFGLTAIFVWAALPSVSALGIKAHISPLQIVFLRFIVAGPVLLYIALRGPNTLADWGKALLLTCGAGAPYLLVVTSGLQYAPASHGGVIVPGAMILVSLIAGHLFLAEYITKTKALGVLFIILGLGFLALNATTGDASTIVKGDLMFVFGGFLWAGYTVLLRLWAIDGLLVTARVSLLSLIMVTAMYGVGYIESFENIPVFDIVIQGLWQGVFSVLVALIAFNKAVAYLGVAKSTVLTALMPVFATIFAYLILDEIPQGFEWAGLVFIMAGVAVSVSNRTDKIRREATAKT